MQTLTPKALADEWARKKTRPVYYLCGEETAMKEAALRRLEGIFKPESFNFSVRDAEISDMGQLTDEARTTPMLAEVRFLALKRTEKLKKEPMKALLAYLEDPCPSACLLILADWSSSTRKDPIPGALAQDCALVDFAPLTQDQAVSRLNAALLAGGVKTDGNALELLVDLLGTDSVILDGEAEKIILYMHGSDRFFGPEDALALAGFSRNQDPFELSRAVCARLPRESSAAAARMLEGGSEPLALLSQLSRSMQGMLKVKRLTAAGDGPSAAYQVGMSPGQFHAITRTSGAYSEDKLLRSLRRCLEAEELLKSSSRRDPGLVLRQLVYEITGTK